MENDLIGLFCEDEESLVRWHLYKTRKKTPALIKSKKPFILENLTNDYCWVNFRFHQADLIRLVRSLGLPNKIICQGRVKVSGIEALCILLKRLAYPNRLSDMMKFFPRTRSELSRIINWTLRFILSRHGHRISSINQSWLSLENAQALASALRAKGCPYRNCFGFLDGTVRPICRPSINQREFYNGHKTVHALKFQSVMLPNGLIPSMFGPVAGRRHDAHLLHESKLIQELEARFYAPNGSPLHLYGDPAYPLRKHLIAPFKGHDLSPAKQKCNKLMSSVRESVEWGFGKIIQLFAFLDYKKNLKIGLQPVGAYYKVAVILTNCHSCLYGSETSLYFNCDAPDLEEYLE